MLSENKRAGRWWLEGDLQVVAVTGNCTVDLRAAEIIGDERTRNVRALMSDVKISIPRGVHVFKEDAAILSSAKDLRDDHRPPPDAPTVRIRGLVVMSSLAVRRGDDPETCRIR